jgi:hypothetical protein
MKILYFLVPGSFFYLFLRDPIMGPLVFAATLLIGCIVYWQIRKRLQLVRAAKRIEPVFVVSRNPDTGATVELPEHLDKHCFHVPYKDVTKIVQVQRALLKESGNPFMSQELPAGQRLPVVAIIFRDGRNVNEEWHEFDERTVLHIKEVRAAWHEELQRVNPAWYWKQHHKQNEIEWDV